MKTPKLLPTAALPLVLLFAPAAWAADIQVLCSLGLKAVMEDLAPRFERETGHKVIVEFDLAATYKRQIEGGKAFDAAFLTPPMIEDLIKQNKIAAGSQATIARTGLGLMIRAGARKPNLATTEGFRRALLDAKGIAFAKEGASGVAFIATIERLGMAEALKSRLKPTASGEDVNALVLRGEADYGVLPLSEILPVKGAELGGMFPADVQTYITMAGGVSATARQSAAARDLMRFLTSAAVLPAIQGKGMER